jgi:hypothetical protein
MSARWRPVWNRRGAANEALIDFDACHLVVKRVERMPRPLLAHGALHADAEIEDLRFYVVLDHRFDAKRKLLGISNLMHVLEKLLRGRGQPRSRGRRVRRRSRS